MSIYLLFIECVCESKFPTENYVWVSKIIHLLVVSAYRSVFIYLFFHFVRCTHTHTSTSIHYTTWCSNMNVATHSIRVWQTATASIGDSLELSKYLLFVFCFSEGYAAVWSWWRWKMYLFKTLNDFLSASMLSWNAFFQISHFVQRKIFWYFFFIK